MPILGQIYRITYVAKNQKSGLSNITAKVLKPDGSIVGPLALAEIVDASFNGAYMAQYTPSTSDPEGGYVFAIASPNEGNHRAFKTESFHIKDTSIPIGDIGINRRSVLEAEVSQKQSIVGHIIEKDIVAESVGNKRVEATFYKDELDYFLDNVNIEGSF